MSLSKVPLKNSSLLPENGGRVFCSLDIETSGFDPLTNEILEVGFAFFKIENSKFKIVEEWTQVFKASKPVAPQILGLTGISQAELDNAPLFSEHKDFLQEKLGTATIVGHNVIFDIKFLQGFGIKFSGEVIDTLDLVQFILPTHHSYNLENLMHTFGISHKEAHRALADSKATVTLLEKLLQVFSSFPKELKESIRKILKANQTSFGVLLEQDLPALTALNKNNELVKSKKKLVQKSALKFQNATIYNFVLDTDYVKEAANILNNIKAKGLLVTSKAQQALSLYKEGLVDGVMFSPELHFSEKKFAAFLKKKNFSLDELKFLLKVLVWQKTNWQTETFLDMNLSFFGGQFRELISSEKLTENNKAKVLACDQKVFLEGVQQGMLKDRETIVCGLNEFEQSVTSDIGSKASWGYITYLFKSLYNFELNIGQEKFKTPVLDGLAASDLFFGIINALLQTDPPSFQYYKILPQTEHDEKYQKIKGAAESYVAKLDELNKLLESAPIAEFTKNIQNFFSPEENMVKWIELAEKRCSLLSMPLEIKSLVNSILVKCENLSFADSLGSEILLKFFMGRLGVSGFSIKNIPSSGESQTEKSKSKQGDLFSGIKKVFGSKNQVVNFHYLPSTANADNLLELVATGKSLPAAILFASPMQTREFYENNYLSIKKYASVLAQSGSGGSNKIFRNFSINPKSLLLATDKFILKHLSGQAQVEPVAVLPVKLLVLCRLPFEQFSHPYQEAVSASLPNAFMDYALPRALLNFHNVLKFFYTPALTDVYIIDAKLSKEYASVFKDYYKQIPKAELK